MSTLEGTERLGLSEFGGAQPLFDAVDLPLGQALAAANCRFAPGKVFTRGGLTSYYSYASGQRVTSSLYFSQGQTGVQTEYFAHLVQTLSTGEVLVVVYNIGTATAVTILSLSGTVNATAPLAIFANVGQRLYAAITQYTTAGVVSARGPYVWDGVESITPTMYPCFQRPMKTTEVTEALTQPGAGVVTAGTHSVGVLFQTKAGYWTKPGPADATTLALVPQSIASTGTNNIRVTLTPASTWPAWIQAVQVIMTTAENSFQYYVVAGTITPVTAGGAGVVTIDINIADEHLTSTGSQGAGTLADDYFSLLSMNASNAQPFSVKSVVQWGQRLVWVVSYGGTDSIFPSEPLNPEWITADQHILQLPGGKAIGSVFVMRGVLYAVSSAGGLYAWVDNGGRPVSFSPAATVDEKISASGFYSTTVAASGGYALIASPQGLFAFSGGTFPLLPISYYQTPTWNTISWSNTAAETMQVLDFPSDRLVIVKAPVSGGAVKLLTWNYNNGMAPDKVQHSIWTAGLTTATPSMTLIHLSGVWQLLIGEVEIFYRMRSSQAGDSGASLYTDYTSTGIDWQYQTALLPRLDDAPMLQHLAVRFRVTALTGTPSVYFSAKSMDDVRTIAMALSPLALSTAPGKEYLAFYDAQEELISYLFTNNSVAGAGISLARLTHFYNFFAEQR